MPASFRFGGGSCCCGGSSPCCGCTVCGGDCGPQEFQAVVTGVTNDQCTDCDELDGTYILSCGVPASDCYWGGDVPTHNCNGGGIYLTNTEIRAYDSGGSTYMHFAIYPDSGPTAKAPGLYWQKNFGASYTIGCRTLVDESLPPVDAGPNIPSGDNLRPQRLCNNNAATCLITSL